MSPSFADLGVPPNIASNLAARGIDAPFPIQAATLPDALAGRDICGRAPTGSGKTIAFGIPMVHRVTKAAPRRPRGLVLVPTRELASQVCEELNILARPKGPWVEAFYGGVGFDKQLRALNKGVDIAVCCPGRLADLINQGKLSLNDVEFVVIDEADRMADMGFLPEVKRILDQCREDRQTLLFSATLDGDVDVLIKKYQRNPARHEYEADQADISRAEHLFWSVERTDRLQTAASIIDRMGPTVVFCRTKRGADRIAKQLETSGVRAAAIHGDRSQSQRERALESFHRGKVAALVATDVAARGIHVDGVECVIHFDPPGDAKDYVHRSGRTARAGNNGIVVSLVPAELRKAVGDLQKDLGYEKGLTRKDLTELDELASRPAPAPSSRKPSSSSRPTGTTRPEPRPVRAAGATRPDRSTRRDHEAPARVQAAPATDRSDDFTDSFADDLATVGPRPADAGPGRSSARPDGREPLADGQKRPSGAARRKAKRLNAIEAVRLERTRDEDDLQDGRSSREPNPRTERKSRGPESWGPGAAKAGGAKGSGGRGGSGSAKSHAKTTGKPAAKAGGRAPAPKRSQGSRPGGETRSPAGRTGGGRARSGGSSR